MAAALPHWRIAIQALIAPLEAGDGDQLVSIQDPDLAPAFDELERVMAIAMLSSKLTARLRLQQIGVYPRESVAEFAEGDIDINWNLAPAEALEWFRKKRVVTRKQFNALSAEARQDAFTVSGIYQQDILEAFHTEIATALEKGTPRQKVVQRFKGILAGAGHRQLGDFHLETVYRVNVQYAMGVENRRGMEEVAGEYPLWRYVAVMDDRTRPAHATLHNVILPANSPFWSDHFPPWQFNCFVPGTMVEGEFLLGLKSRYAGNVVEISTRGGKTLTVTANHPILTPAGFTPANSLTKGGYVLSYRAGIPDGEFPDRPGEGAIGLSGSTQPQLLAPSEHVDQGPAPIEKIFGALANIRSVLRVPIKRDDLHGDAEFGDGYCHVVGPLCEFLLSRQSQCAQRFGDFRLSEVNSAHADIISLRSPDERGHPLLAAAHRSPGSTALPLDEVATLPQLRPLQPLRVGLGAEIHTRRPQTIGQSLARDMGFACELIDRYPGFVLIDEIVQVRELNYTGHVYDLQSVGGWLIAQGIFASNCRCDCVPLREYPEDYDPRNPTGNFELTLDSNGVPVQAEYGAGTVIDLTVAGEGGFQGVPPQRRLPPELQPPDMPSSSARPPKDFAELAERIYEIQGRYEGEKRDIAAIEVYPTQDPNQLGRWDGFTKTLMLPEQTAFGLSSSLEKLQRGETLTLDEADTLLTVWHELLHARGDTAFARFLPHSNEWYFKELVTEFDARLTFEGFVDELGIPRAQARAEEMIAHGKGYQSWIVDMTDVLEAAGIGRSEARAFFTTAGRQMRVPDLPGEIAKLLNRQLSLVGAEAIELEVLLRVCSLMPVAVSAELLPVVRAAARRIGLKQGHIR